METEIAGPRPGSAPYYAIRFAHRAARPDLGRLYGLVRRLDALPRECSDPGVAFKKLAWWREELERGFQGAPRHPATQALADLLTRRPLPRAQFDQLLDGIELEITARGFDSEAAFDDYCRRTGGSIAQLFTAAAGGDADEAAAGAALGCFSRRVRIVRNLGRDLRQGRLLLPRAPLEAQGAAPARLLDAASAPAVRSVLAEMAPSLRAEYLEAVAAMPQGGRAGLGPACSFGAMAAALLDEIEAGGFDVLERRTSLTPMRKLWIAWRLKRAI